MGNCLDSESAHDDISLLRESNSTTQRDNSSDQLGPPHAYQVSNVVVWVYLWTSETVQPTLNLIESIGSHLWELPISFADQKNQISNSFLFSLS